MSDSCRNFRVVESEMRVHVYCEDCGEHPNLLGAQSRDSGSDENERWASIIITKHAVPKFNITWDRDD